ncbi:MAG: hypothetical protein WC831_03335 [Parcubacteria group bacterium]
MATEVLCSAAEGSENCRERCKEGKCPYGCPESSCPPIRQRLGHVSVRPAAVNGQRFSARA